MIADLAWILEYSERPIPHLPFRLVCPPPPRRCWRCRSTAYTIQVRAYHPTPDTYIVDYDWRCLDCGRYLDGYRWARPLEKR